MKKILFSLIILLNSGILNSAGSPAQEPLQQNMKQFLPTFLRMNDDEAFGKIGEKIKEGMPQGHLNLLLFAAIMSYKPKTVKLLLDNNAQTNINDVANFFSISGKKGNTPLIFALEPLVGFANFTETQLTPITGRTSLDMVKELILHGASTHIANQDGDTPISLLAKLHPKHQKEIQDTIDEYIANFQKHKKEIEESTGLPKELAELTAQQLFGELKPSTVTTNQD